MKRKILFCVLIFLVVFTTSSFAFAQDSLDNATVTMPDDASDVVCEDAISSSEITVTDENYDSYFYSYNGKLKDDVKSNVNTLKIGNVSEKVFTIDKPLNILPSSSDVQIKNGVIHLVPGSSGSNITNIIINNTKGEIYRDGLFVSKLHGIWFTNSSDNLIYNNTIRIPGEEGCYAMPMGYSSRNRILYNDIMTTFTSAIVMGSCDYNNISYNRIEVTSYRDMVTSNLIYFNYYGHADYQGPADCIGNYISNNYLKGFCNGIWSIIVNLMGNCDDTVFVNNTVFKGFYGISIYQEGQRNCIIKNNTVIDGYTSILASGNVLVCDNKITGSSMSVGIATGGSENYKSNVTVLNNYIDYRDLGCGISIMTDSIVENNTVKISNYGEGMIVSSEHAVIRNNIIKVGADVGIFITNSSILISNNFISTLGNGIILISEEQNNGKIYKYYNNSIVGNTILADKYAVYIKGYVYNTLVDGNVIETNLTEAFYINVEETFEDRNSGNFTDNMVNGVIENTETLIIDDNNFYDYFDDEGYLKYSFKPDSKKILFFTFLTNKDIFLTDKIILTSNKMPNLLYNVSITFTGDASQSTISDFNFYNLDKSSIILDGVEDVMVENNDFTTVTSDIFDVNAISIVGGGVGCEIRNNNIFMSSKANYTYAIYVSEPSYSIIKRISRNFNIADNNILIKAEGVGEGIYCDALVESRISNNVINIISGGSAYGIAVCNVFSSLYDLNIDSNEIFVNSKDMSYLIEIYRCNDCNILNNHISGFSNGVYGIGIYNGENINIKRNEINVCGLNLTGSHPNDALGKGNSAIYIARQSQINSISNNIFDCENVSVLTNLDCDINKFDKNSFVISDYNYDLYFDFENNILNDTIKHGDRILFKNFTQSKVMNINIPIIIDSYGHFNDFKAILVLSKNATGSNVSNLNFIDAKIILNNTSDILISNNSFLDSHVFDIKGYKNNISNNVFLNFSDVNLSNSSSFIFSFNNVSVESEFIKIFDSNYALVSDNIFNSNNTVILSNNSLYNSILDNDFNVNASFCYFANNSGFDDVEGNYILIKFENPTAIYYAGNSSKNSVNYNKILSYSKEGLDYAVVVDFDGLYDNVIANNYLIASNGFKRGNDAVNAGHNIVCNNTPVEIYVSVNGSLDGDGSLENPYQTIAKAVENSLSGAIIHILPGMYNESNIVIDKNITLTAENIEGNTYINALNKRLFNITSTGSLAINALKIFNGFSVEGGSLFYNHGTLIINNSIVYNSSSYYDNSNPTFKGANSEYVSYDCSNLGLGGAILNYGDLIITSSTLFDNFAHEGGAIADFGKTIIKNSLICNNSATHGGALFTDSDDELTIENCIFEDNLAVTTLDYCFIKRTESTDYGYRYIFNSACEVTPGHGGAIYAATSMNVKNTLFEHNIARCGGAIAYYSSAVDKYNQYRQSIDYSSNEKQILFPSDYNLNIENSAFRYNEAKDTTGGNKSLLKVGKYETPYDKNRHGGAIFGSLNEFNVLNSLFENNKAYDDGGALCVQSLNSTIEGSKFYNNTAGALGGALDVFGNYKVFNTEISGNNAKSGGALVYAANSYYGHIQNDMNMFNVTVSNNQALEMGGAMAIAGNMVITHSNIYGNTAPEGSTISGYYNAQTNSKIDARSNWWGSTEGPDDSVWYQSNTRFRTWLSDKVNWGATSISPSAAEDNNGGNNNGGSSKSSQISTGSSVHTGSTLTFYPDFNKGNIGVNFNGNWPSGNNMGGNNGGFNYTGGENPFSSSGNSKTNVEGNAFNPNSLSKTNSSSVNDLASVGMTANAADSSSSSQSSISGEEGIDGFNNAYEITKKADKNIDDDLSEFNILFILLWIFLVIGFYRKYNEDKN